MSDEELIAMMQQVWSEFEDIEKFDLRIFKRIADILVKDRATTFELPYYMRPARMKLREKLTLGRRDLDEIERLVNLMRPVWEASHPTLQFRYWPIFAGIAREIIVDRQGDI